MASELDRISGLSVQIAALDAQIEQVRAESSMLRHIDDDAQRDAAVSDRWDDRADARRTAADVARIDQQIVGMENSRSSLVAKRNGLISKLAAG